jgi:Cyclin M transmembrane N-terminal domain
MELPTTFGLLAVVLLVLANGFFVATEFAIVAVRRSRLEQLAAEGRVSARAAQDVVGHLDTYIAACQLGITMASLALANAGIFFRRRERQKPLELSGVASRPEGRENLLLLRRRPATGAARRRVAGEATRFHPAVLTRRIVTFLESDAEPRERWEPLEVSGGK